MGRVRLAAVAFLFLLLAPLRADAAQHLWEIKEIYSNASGTVQYIELFTTFGSQTVLTGHTLVINDGADHTFTFPTDLPVDTTNKHMLIATAGFKNMAGAPTPDYTLPCGQFFNPSATTITITFDGTSDVESFLGTSLPKDGINSLTDSALSASGNATFSSGMNSPTNIAGATGPITLTSEQNDGTVSACNDGLFCNGAETCSAGTCAGVAPCAQQCDEGTNTCVECLNVTHCNDNNSCTDDTCNGSGVCEHASRDGLSCTDGLFCNGVDTCSGTTCTHAGDPCAGINCNEGPDTCGDCTGAPDCEDGEPCTVDTCTTGQCNRATAANGAVCDNDTTYCNGVGACTTGVCGAIAAPCDSMTETCEEANDSCAPIPVTGPDASVDPGTMTPDDEGGCCQANTTPATFTGPGLVLLLGLAFGRRRRRR